MVRDIYSALIQGDLVTARVFLREKPDLEKYQHGKTILHEMAWDGNVEAVRLLLEHGANVNASDRETGVTALHHAANKGRVEVILVLLEHGADIHATDINGQTVLHWAAFVCHPPTIQLILARGMDANSVQEDGTTALIQVAQQCREVQRWKYVAGADPVASTRLLLEHGADVNRTDQRAKTALMYAQEEGCRLLVKTLRAAGAQELPLPVPSPPTESRLSPAERESLKQQLEALGVTVVSHQDGSYEAMVASLSMNDMIEIRVAFKAAKIEWGGSCGHGHCGIYVAVEDFYQAQQILQALSRQKQIKMWVFDQKQNA
jgi:ankyrin repeat protein